MIKTDPVSRKSAGLSAICSILLLLSGSALAEPDWYALTIDNDLFVGSDNGYTNGIYFSWFDLPDEEATKPGFLARSMLWSLSDAVKNAEAFGVRTVGQSMITPDDITLEEPPRPPDDLPYAGLLFYTDTWVKVNAQQAERVGVTIGIVGEYSYAEQTQTLVHDILGSDEPKGWDTQLNNEIVFQFSRGQVWRSWVAVDGSTDLLLGADAGVGTLSSYVGGSIMYRYGEDLLSSYATATLGASRVSNPVATRSGWYVFAALSANYLANQIFLDGNTFDNDGQEPMDYDPFALGASLGVAYAWSDLALTFAVNDMSLAEDDDNVDEYSRYGTLTVAWRTR